MLYQLHYILNWSQGIFFLTLLLFTSCTTKNNDLEKKLLTKTLSENLSVRAVDSAEFRTLYQELIYEDSAKTVNNFDSNPELMTEISQQLNNRLLATGLINNNRLILDRFKSNENFQLRDSSGNNLKVSMKYIVGPSIYHISVAGKNEIATIDFTEYLPIVKVAVADIIPGGFKELIVLRNLYIMNGDNYYINIYEIKEKADL